MCFVITRPLDTNRLSSRCTAPEPEPVVEGEAVPVASGERGELPERQRSLFSWAEFMAGEPEEPPRKRRNEAPTLSLFEWALEREREEELVGTVR